MFASRESKLNIPRDLSIVGIDDLDLAELLEPKPTVVATPILTMARQAIELLLTEIKAKRPPSGRRDIHRPWLISRESCAQLTP